MQAMMRIIILKTILQKVVWDFPVTEDHLLLLIPDPVTSSLEKY